MGTMSKRSFMMIDPLVEDPEFEHDAVVAEQLEQALLVSIQQQASEGIIPPSRFGSHHGTCRQQRLRVA